MHWYCVWCTVHVHVCTSTSGQTLGEVEVCTKDVAYSPEVHGLSVVLSDGRAAFISAKSARYEPQVAIGEYVCTCSVCCRNAIPLESSRLLCATNACKATLSRVG